MKSEHRHELAQNDLEVLGKKLGQKSKDYWEENGNRVLLYTSLVLLLLAAIIFYVRSNEATNLAAWSRFNNANGAAEFSQVAQDFEGTVVGHWANLRVAEINLTTATEQLFQDSETAKTELKTVLDSLEKQANTSGKPAQVEVRVLYALARAQETLSEGDNSKAVATYEKIMGKFPDTVHSELAKQRIEVLNREGTSEFYAWFSKQKFEPEKQIDLPEDGKTADEKTDDKKSDGTKSAVPPVPGFSGEQKMKTSDKKEEKSDDKAEDKKEEPKKESPEKTMTKPEEKKESEDQPEKKESAGKKDSKSAKKSESSKVEKKTEPKKEAPEKEAKKEDSKPSEKAKADKPKEAAKSEDKKE